MARRPLISFENPSPAGTAWPTSLYNIDETGVGAIVRDVGPETTGHPFFGESSKAAGEAIFYGRRVFINDSTGRGVRNLRLAKEFFEAIGYQVESREWGRVRFPDHLPAGGNLPLTPP